MSGAGRGDFVGAMLRDETIPPPGFHLFPLGPDGSSIVYAEEISTLPTILQLNYEVTLLAIRLALLAQELREQNLLLLVDGETRQHHHQRIIDLKLRQSRVYDIQESLRSLWIAEPVMLISQQTETLPPRSKYLYENAYMLYRACIIYSHTSMWIQQRLDTGPEFDSEIADCAFEILRTSSRVIEAEHQLELRFFVFPLFMAGFASVDGTQKMMALDLIKQMEGKSIGGNTSTTRKTLETVYETQTTRFMVTGQDRDVDWMEVMVGTSGGGRLQIINFGL